VGADRGLKVPQGPDQGHPWGVIVLSIATGILLLAVSLIGYQFAIAIHGAP